MCRWEGQPPGHLAGQASSDCLDGTRVAYVSHAGGGSSAGAGSYAVGENHAAVESSDSGNHHGIAHSPAEGAKIAAGGEVAVDTAHCGTRQGRHTADGSTAAADRENPAAAGGNTGPDNEGRCTAAGGHTAHAADIEIDGVGAG